MLEGFEMGTVGAAGPPVSARPHTNAETWDVPQVRLRPHVRSRARDWLNG